MVDKKNSSIADSRTGALRDAAHRYFWESFSRTRLTHLAKFCVEERRFWLEKRKIYGIVC